MSSYRLRGGGGPVRPSGLVLVLLLVVAGWLATGAPASAAPLVWAFPDTSNQGGAGGGLLSCLPTDPFCMIGQAAGAAVADVWITAMLSLWQAGLWLLGLSFSVIDALTTPDLSADGALSAIYPVTFGIGASLAVLMALVQLGVAAARRDGQSLGRLLVGLLQFGLVWVSYIGIAALLVTGVSGLTTSLLQSLLHIDRLAAFKPSISVSRDLVDGTVATVLGVSSIFLLIPASVGYLLLMLVREAALIVLAATSAISAGGLLAQTSSAWFWRSLRWFLAALLVAPVAVLVLGVGVTITEGVLTGAAHTSTERAVGMAVVGCLLILLGAICPLALFRLLAFVDPGTSSGAGLRSSLTASGGVLGALQRLGGGGPVAAAAAAAGSGGMGAAGASAAVAGDRAQGEATADAATSGRFAASLRALATGTSQAGRLAAGVAASASDVLSGSGVGHAAPYYGQPARPSGSASAMRPARIDDGALAYLPPEVIGAAEAPTVAGEGGGTPGLPWPAQHVNGVGLDVAGDKDGPGGPAPHGGAL